MTTLTVSRRINAPIDKVWDVITDIDRAPDTITAIESVERLPGPSTFDIGLRWRETRTMFGKPTTAELEVVRVEPQREYTVVSRGASTDFESVMCLESTGDGTTVTMTLSAVAKTMWARFMERTIGRIFRRASRRMLMADLDDIADSLG